MEFNDLIVAIDSLCELVDASPLAQQRVAGHEEIMCLVSEVLEGHRAHIEEDAISNHRLLELELAEMLIRVCALAGRLKLGLGKAVATCLQTGGATEIRWQFDRGAAEGGVQYREGDSREGDSLRGAV